MEHTVLVAGATAGFGEATARRFLANGHKVIALGEGIERLELLKGSLPIEQQKKLLTLVVDVCDSAKVDQLASSLPTEFSQVTILVNNADLALDLELEQQAVASYRDQMVDTNIKGLVHMTRAFLPGMVERKRGHVINAGPMTSGDPHPGDNLFGGTKAFVKQFSLNLRADVVGTPIRVTCIESGMGGGVEFSRTSIQGKGEKVEGVHARAQALTADNIAEAIFWSATLPSHVNINVLEVMPVQQASGPMKIHRGET